MIHSFDSAIAEEYGILEAILLNHIYYWIEKNRANEQNFHDGTYWTYNSTKAFSSLFSYASERQIKAALMKLRENGILITGNYNENPYDRTLWYALSEKGLCIVQNRTMGSTEPYNQVAETGQSLNNTNNIYNTTDIKPDINQINTFCEKPEEPALTQNKDVDDFGYGNKSFEKELAVDDSEPVIISLPLNNKTKHNVYQKDIDYWKELYPAIDVEQELKNMLGWLDSNPANRKTPRGIKRFINGWLARAQNKAPRVVTCAPGGQKTSRWEDML
ncbi:hypothetical protein [Enterocloster lavalensis]|uniref:hypothetical protein n=1 Tax=Enterocloster lavalensis TaxID=460384 RepID=UPI0034A2A636